MANDTTVFRQRMMTALQADGPSESLYALLRELKAEGVSSLIMIKLLTGLEARHRRDTNETIYNAILFGIDVVFSTTHLRRIFNLS